jgi:hypothetical protein
VAVLQSWAAAAVVATAHALLPPSADNVLARCVCHVSLLQRTLAAADNALLLIDGAKGIEAQTRKLFAVARLKGLPVFSEWLAVLARLSSWRVVSSNACLFDCSMHRPHPDGMRA